jgi:hypothetical protein
MKKICQSLFVLLFVALVSSVVQKEAHQKLKNGHAPHQHAPQPEADNLQLKM